MSINAIGEKLESKDFLTQVAGLDEARATIELLIRASVEALFRTSTPYVIAEKVFALGSGAIPHLERKLDEGGSPEAITFAALILLRLSSTKGGDLLLRSLRDGVGPRGMIAQAISAAGLSGASESITGALERMSINDDPYTAVTLAYALRDLKCSIPERAIQQLETHFPNIRSLL